MVDLRPRLSFWKASICHSLQPFLGADRRPDERRWPATSCLTHRGDEPKDRLRPRHSHLASQSRLAESSASALAMFSRPTAGRSLLPRGAGWGGDGSIPIVLNGVVGPRGDGYVVGSAMTGGRRRKLPCSPDRGASRWRRRHGERDRHGTWKGGGHYIAARTSGVPVAVSFTVETDGRLPVGAGAGRQRSRRPMRKRAGRQPPT